MVGRKLGTSFREKLLDPGDSLGVVVPTVLSYENETDLREALENFRAYLSILREWDQQEPLEREDLPGQDVQDSSIDWEPR